MGYVCNFLSNQTYTADDVNKAFSRLTTQGVSLFSDTGQPLADLNTATANLVGSGVELYNLDACKVIKTGADAYKVMPGTAFMPQGQAITVDAEGYSFTASEGTAYSVIMFAAANTGVITARAGDLPSNSILLATISADGTVTDRRTYAKTKVAPATANIVIEKQTGQFSMNRTDYESVNVDVGYSAFSYVRLWYDAYDKLYLAHEHITLENGVEQSLEILQANSSGSRSCFAKITKNNNILSMSFKSNVSMVGYHNFSLIVF